MSNSEISTVISKTVPCKKCGETIKNDFKEHLRHLRDKHNITGITFKPVCNCDEFGAIEPITSNPKDRYVYCPKCNAAKLLEEVF